MTFVCLFLLSASALLIAQTTTPVTAQDLMRHEDWEVAHAKAIATRSAPLFEVLIEAAVKHQFPPALRAKVHNNYGAALYQAGDYAGAERQYTEAIKWARHGSLQDELGAALSNLAETLRQLDRLDESEKNYVEAIAAREDLTGAQESRLALTLNNLGTLQRTRGQLTEARKSMERALAIRSRVLPPTHPDLASSLANFGALLQDMSQLTEAKDYYRRALAINPGHAAANNNLGTLLQREGRSGEALPYFEIAERLWTETGGADHPALISVRNNLAELHVANANYAEADRLFRKALALAEQRLGQSHPQTLLVAHNLGVLFLYQEKAAAAEVMFRRVLEARPDDPAFLHQCARSLHLQGRFTEAERLYDRALEQPPLKPSERPLILLDLAALHYQSGNFSQAEKDLIEVASQRALLNGEQKQNATALISKLSLALQDTRSKRQAERVEALVKSFR